MSPQIYSRIDKAKLIGIGGARISYANGLMAQMKGLPDDCDLFKGKIVLDIAGGGGVKYPPMVCRALKDIGAVPVLVDREPNFEKFETHQLNLLEKGALNALETGRFDYVFCFRFTDNDLESNLKVQIEREYQKKPGGFEGCMANCATDSWYAPFRVSSYAINEIYESTMKMIRKEIFAQVNRLLKEGSCFITDIYNMSYMSIYSKNNDSLLLKIKK